MGGGGVSVDVNVLVRATAKARFIDLSKFVSVYAEPGASVTFSGIDWATSVPSQAVRRSNWRILMEACLYANGGTGEHDGNGWYTISGTGRPAATGEVYISGPLYIEPYADSEYAPFFATADTTQLGATTRGWTFPGGITISGNGGTQAYSQLGLSEMAFASSRLIGYGAPAAQFYGGAGPAASGSTISRHISHWALKGIGLVRVGDSAVASVANPVLRAAHFYDTGAAAITSVCQSWTIDDVVIDLQPTTSAYAQVGALIQAGLYSQVPTLRVYGHENPGWGLVVTGCFNGTAKIAQTTTLWFGDVVSGGSKRGVLFSYASCFMHSLNIEPYGSGANSKQQLIIGDGVSSGIIDMLWVEAARQPDIATASGADQASVVIGGIDSEWNPNYGVGTYTKPGPFTIHNAVASGYSGSAPDYAFTLKSCTNFQLGVFTAATFNTAIIHIDPGTVSVAGAIGYMEGSYDSSKTQWGSCPAFLVDDSDYAYNGYTWSSGVIDRAIVGGDSAPAKPNRTSGNDGTGVVGFKTWASAPVAGGPVGWVCTTAGAYPTQQHTPFGSSWLSGSATFNPADLADGAGETTTVTVTGAALGDFVMVSFSLDTTGLTITGWVSAADTVSVRFQNEVGAGNINIGSGTLRARVFHHD